VWSLFDRVSRRLVRRGLRQGLLEGSSIWLAVAALAWLFRLLTSAERPQIVRQDLAVGESIVVTHRPPPPTRRQLRRARRRERRAGGGRGSEGLGARS
jgi:hypothetical protein